METSTIHPHNAQPDSLQTTLQTARKSKRLSQLELALRMGVSQRHVSFVESGRAQPSRELLLSWLHELQAPLALRNVALQSELAHANRVATMGHLVASIAHEVNQPIAAAILNADAALRWMSLQPPQIDEVRNVLGSLILDANRAADVLGRIRQHIRKTPPEKGPVDITAAIGEMIELTRSQVTKNGASLLTEINEQLPSIVGDRVELQQVLLNLIMNALEAMNGVAEDERQLHISAQLDDAGCVRVSVRDSGPGFSSENTEQIFASFYTTKPTGMGMGLSICRSIIEAHGGRLWASANAPHGATVQFTLPVEQGPGNT